MFEKGNKWAQEWTLENALPRFEDALKFATEDENCLCLQDAIYKTAIPHSSFDELVKNHNVLGSIKKDIQDQIIMRVNKLAIKDEAPAAPAIWRMKQLGERDEQHVTSVVTGKQEVTVRDPQTAKDLQDLIDKFDEE